MASAGLPDFVFLPFSSQTVQSGSSLSPTSSSDTFTTNPLSPLVLPADVLVERLVALARGPVNRLSPCMDASVERLPPRAGGVVEHSPRHLRALLAG